MRCDCHNDAALFLREQASLWSLPMAQFDFARAGRVLDLAFCAIWIDERSYAGRETTEFRRVQQALNQDIAALPQVERLLWREQLERLPSPQLLALTSMEGATPLGDDGQLLEEFYAQGLRALGLTWNAANAYAGSSFSGGGLTEAGQSLVRRCNQLGVLLDAAHGSSETLRDLLRYSQAPLIDSHTVCAALCDAFPRAVSDDELRELAAGGGVAGICFVPDFLGGSGDLEQLCRHLEHAAELIGSEHVAIGGDLDGCTPLPPLDDIVNYPQLWERLRQRGWSEADIANVQGDSVLRLLRQVLPAEGSGNN